MNTVVSNASPLIALEQLGLLHLLKEIFGKVLIPTTVAREVAPTVNIPDWITYLSLSQELLRHHTSKKYSLYLLLEKNKHF